ncbi:MAG: tRNA (N(6)-L-threonylcarbamoyladenosine(37)-C(2))-methylthiotransferase MtaB, partial [Nitrospirae bacterium]|nr:tRNA (N(6)-L-threonylcarbamoyladenosine(37)-C(2))-methylthiotransferase MtaB [Nitrospirota bacterium]
MKIAFTTLGCKVNQFDTAIMEASVTRESHEIVPYEEKADLYVINTCTVTDNADLESRHWVKKALQKNPDAKIMVTGCYAQTNPAEVKNIPGVDLILGNEEKKFISSFLPVIQPGPILNETAGVFSEQVSCVGEISREKIFKQPLIESFLDKTRAFLKVQDGCNARCSFCIIPKARGRSRSFSIEEVIAQTALFEERGYNEVVLTGINLGSYGLDFSPKTSLVHLLSQMEKKTSRIRFRFSSIEPEYFTDDLIEAFSNSKRVCHHFHIPLQSGHAGILKKMNRKYSPEYYRGLLEKIHHKMPDAAIGADVMTGFPGETLDEFQATCQLLARLPVAYLHVFPYSMRENTSAAELPDTVSPAEKKERSNQLRQLSKSKNEAFKKNFIGKSLTVLIENKKEGERPDFGVGLSDNYLKILIKDGGHL